MLNNLSEDLRSASLWACIVGCLGMISVFTSCSSEHVPSSARTFPNVVLILTDDQGYGDFSCHGNPVLKTPALDRLHDESIHFDDFHVSPQCTPTRGQLMTGLDALDNKAMTVLAGTCLMRRDLVTMPEIFRRNGYATGIFGKWHLGDNYPDRPMDRGFQKCIWHLGWGLGSESEYDNDYYETRYLDGLKTRYSHKYCTNLWFDKAIEWMDEMAGQDRPFFTYLSLNAPHSPFHSLPQDFDYYEGEVEEHSAASFFGMIRNIDRNIARFEDWLEERDLKDNTLVVFLTDNGGTGGVEIHNAGMRGRKESNYEGGHRAACFIRWPNGNFVSPYSVKCATQIQDLLPTFLDILDLEGRPDYELDGVSLRPVLMEGRPLNDRMFVVQFGPDARPEEYFRCVVWDSWRLVGEDELYDLSTDPRQQKNIAGEYPEIIREMNAFHREYWTEVEAGIDQFVPVIVSSEREDPKLITSSIWEEGAVNGQRGVARALGPPKGGITHIDVVQEGRYRVELSRWPFHLKRGLTVIGPEMTIGGTRIETGRAVPIEFGCLSIDEEEPLISRRIDAEASISLEINLTAGRHTMRAWFKGLNGDDLCGAYYVKLKRLL